MAKACPPFNDKPNFMQKLERDDPDAFVTGAINHQVANGRIVQDREGFKARASQQIADELARTANVTPDAVVDYIRAKGWLTDANNLGKPLWEPESEYAVGFLKTYVEGTAVGVRELGNTFLAKANEGFDATVEGLKFAQQLKAISKLGEVILGIDQAAGRRTLVSRQDYRGAGASSKAMKAALDEDELLTENLIKQEGFTDVLSEIAKDLQDPVNSGRAINKLIDLANMVQFVDRPDRIARATMNLRQIGAEVVAEYMVNSLLSSPATLGAAASGVLWVPMRQMLAVAGSPVMAVVGGTDAAGTTLQQSLAGLSAMRQSFTEAMALGWNAFKTERSVYQKTRTPGIKAYMSDPQVQRIAEAQGDETAQNIVNVINGIGSFTRWPSRVLLGLDEAARHMASRAEVAQRGVKNAFDEGINPADNEAIRARITQEFEDAFTLQSVGGRQRRAGISNIYENASAKKYGRTIDQVAASGTFQEDNFIAKWVSGVLDKAPMLKPFMPFVKTPLNILNQGLMIGDTKTALGALYDVTVNGSGNAASRVAQLQQQMLKNPQEAARVAGQLGFTTAMAAVVYNLATSTDDDGRQILSGGGPSRWMQGRAGFEAQASWEAAGNARYSIRSGDTVIPFDRFGEPFATVMRMIADIATVSAFLPDDEKDTLFASQVSVMVSGLYNSSFMSSFNDLADIVFSLDNPRELDKVLAGGVRTYVNTFTPMGGLLGYIERIDDPYKTAYEPGGFMDLFGSLEQQIGNGALANAARRIPGNGLPTQLDQILGEPIPLYPGMGPEGISAAEMAIPLFPRKQDEAKPAVKAWNQIAGSYKRYVPNERQRAFQLTPEETNRLDRAMATITINGRTFSDAIMEVYNRREVQDYLASRGTRYGNLSNQWADELNKLRRLYGKAAYNQMLQTDESLFEREAMLQQLKDAEKGNDGSLVIERKDALQGLYERARSGG